MNDFTSLDLDCGIDVAKEGGDKTDWWLIEYDTEEKVLYKLNDLEAQEIAIAHDKAMLQKTLTKIRERENEKLVDVFSPTLNWFINDILNHPKILFTYELTDKPSGEWRNKVRVLKTRRLHTHFWIRKENNRKCIDIDRLVTELNITIGKKHMILFEKYFDVIGHGGIFIRYETV